MDKYTVLCKLFVAADVPESVFESLAGFILLRNHRSIKAVFRSYVASVDFKNIVILKKENNIFYLQG